MSVKIYDSTIGAFKDAETPLIWDEQAQAWKDSVGLVWNESAQAWEERWGDNKLWLYKDGDECIDITGGWIDGVRSGWSTITKNPTNINMALTPSGGAIMGIVTSNKIKTFGYSKICLEYSLNDIPSQTAVKHNKAVFINDNDNNYYYGYAYQAIQETRYDYIRELTCSTPSIRYVESFSLEKDYNNHIGVARRVAALSTHMEMTLYKLWLEK